LQRIGDMAGTIGTVAKNILPQITSLESKQVVNALCDDSLNAIESNLVLLNYKG